MGMSVGQRLYNAVLSNDLRAVLEIIEGCDDNNNNSSNNNNNNNGVVVRCKHKGKVVEYLEEEAEEEQEDWRTETSWIGPAMAAALESPHFEGWEIVKTLLRHGADPNSRGLHDDPLIFHVPTTSAYEFSLTINDLCYWGADINSLNSTRETLLERELEESRYENSRYETAGDLHTDFGAYLTVNSLQILRRQSLINGVCYQGVSEEEKNFLRYCEGFPEMDLYTAAGQGHVKTVKKILATCGSTTTAAHRYEDTGLGLKNINHMFDYTNLGDDDACYKGETKAEPFGTALMEASFRGRLAVVEVLLSAGADPNVTTSRGESALQWAVQAGHYAVTVLLIQANADVNAQSDRFGFTPLHETAIFYSPYSHISQSINRTHIAEALLQASCDIYLEDDEGQTALNLAINPHIASLLMAEPGRRRDLAWQRRGWLACLRKRDMMTWEAAQVQRVEAANAKRRAEENGGTSSSTVAAEAGEEDREGKVAERRCSRRLRAKKEVEVSARASI